MPERSTVRSVVRPLEQQLFCEHVLTPYAKDCGSALAPAATNATESDCSSPCTGNANEPCGGANRLSLYYSSQPVGPQPNPGVNGFSYVGCYSYVISEILHHHRGKDREIVYVYPMLIDHQRGNKWQGFDTRHWIRPCGTDDDCRMHISLQGRRLLTGWY